MLRGRCATVWQIRLPVTSSHWQDIGNSSTC